MWDGFCKVSGLVIHILSVNLLCGYAYGRVYGGVELISFAPWSRELHICVLWHVQT